MNFKLRVWSVIKPDNPIPTLVTIMKNKSDGTYSFVNLTKMHICQCKFESVSEAIADMDRRVKEGTILKYTELEK